MALREPPPDFRFTLNVRRQQGWPEAGNSAHANAVGRCLPGSLRWFQHRLWRLKWAECIILMWAVIAFGTANQPLPVTVGQIVGMLIVSPLAALMFLAMLKAFVFVIVIGSGPIALIVVRQCVYYHDRFLATFCEEPITFGKGY